MRRRSPFLDAKCSIHILAPWGGVCIRAAVSKVLFSGMTWAKRRERERAKAFKWFIICRISPLPFPYFGQNVIHSLEVWAAVCCPGNCQLAAGNGSSRLGSFFSIFAPVWPSPQETVIFWNFPGQSCHQCWTVCCSSCGFWAFWNRLGMNEWIEERREEERAL